MHHCSLARGNGCRRINRESGRLLLRQVEGAEGAAAVSWAPGLGLLCYCFIAGLEASGTSIWVKSPNGGKLVTFCKFDEEL